MSDQLRRFTRDRAVQVCRDSLTAHRGTHDANATTYDPPDWVVDAMRRAYESGRADMQAIAAEFAASALYPEGG
jgi:hypothetical protein